MARKETRSSGGTPATVTLTRAGIAFTVRAYDHDPATTAFGEEAAAALGVVPTRIFKTLVLQSDSLLVAVVPVSTQLDLKAVAAAAGVKRVELADPVVATRSTGYVVGGISPIGQRHPLPTLVDASAADFPTILVSAGRRGLQVELDPSDLVRLTRARLAPIAARR